MIALVNQKSLKNSNLGHNAHLSFTMETSPCIKIAHPRRDTISHSIVMEKTDDQRKKGRKRRDRDWVDKVILRFSVHGHLILCSSNFLNGPIVTRSKMAPVKQGFDK